MSKKWWYKHCHMCNETKAFKKVGKEYCCQTCGSYYRAPHRIERETKIEPAEKSPLFGGMK